MLNECSKFGGSTIFILPDSPTVFDSVDVSYRVSHGDIQLLRLCMIDVPRIGDRLNLGGILFQVYAVEWTPIESLLHPWHPILRVKEARES